MSELHPAGDEPAHDVLAAEAFAMPAPDPALHHGPVVLPEDPSGIEEPHDVLAAEDFAMPAPPQGRALASRTRSRARIALTALAGAAIVLLALRLVRRH